MPDPDSTLDVEFTDRYQALGIPYPDPATMCPAECEGTGVVPVRADDADPRLAAAWAKSADEPDEIGYKFVICPDCDGTGKRPPVPDPQETP